MKLQSYMGKEPILRMMIFSASIFFILLVFPLLHDSSFLKTTTILNNSYSILVTLVDKVPENEVNNWSTPASITSNRVKVNATEMENNLEKSTDAPVQVGFSDSKGNKNNFQNKKDQQPLRVDESKHESLSSSSIPLSPLKTRHNVSTKGNNTTHSLVKGEDSLKLQLSRLVRGQEGLAELESTGIACSSDSHLDMCVISQPIVLEKHNKSFNIYAKIPSIKSSVIIRPYPKKEDSNTMKCVAPVNIVANNSIKPPSCEVKHNVPALVFSFGGFTDNIFHKFSEVIIPLFITSRHFGSRVQLVVTDNKLGETWKFTNVLKHLSPYDLIDANAEDDKRVHCFPGAVVGLRFFDNLEVNSTDTPGGYTMSNFRKFLRESYHLKVESTLKPKRPKVLFISRQRTRSFLNEDKILRLMKKLGLRVQKVKPSQMSNLGKFAKLVNSCDMMVGVHGAGLTNEIFLPDGAVVVQIVPLGLEWGSEHYYAIPSQKMGLKYLEYKIQPNESSLYHLYGPNDPVVSDPGSIWAKGYEVVKDVYLDRQQIRVDLIRFRSALVEALKLLR